MTQQTYSVEELQAYIEANYHPELTCQSVEIAQQLLEREGHYEDLLEQSAIFIKENEALKAENERLKSELISQARMYLEIGEAQGGVIETLKSQVDVAVKAFEDCAQLEMTPDLYPPFTSMSHKQINKMKCKIAREALSQLQKEEANEKA